MRPSLFLPAVFAASAVCDTLNAYQAPSSTDKRSPCPMINALANHNFLPHNGLNISMAILITALNDSINLASDATELVGGLALTTGNNVTFDLDNLDKHNILEHDGSLSRSDYALGDDHTFNTTIWTSTLTHFPNSTITLANAVSARSARLVAAAAANLEFSFSASNAQNSMIESALYMTVFANGTGARTEWVRVLFEEERLPYVEGWRRSESQLTTAGILGVVGEIAAS